MIVVDEWTGCGNGRNQVPIAIELIGYHIDTRAGTEGEMVDHISLGEEAILTATTDKTNGRQGRDRLGDAYGDGRSTNGYRGGYGPSGNIDDGDRVTNKIGHIGCGSIRKKLHSNGNRSYC